MSPCEISPDFRPYPRTTGENFRDKLDGNVLEAFLPLPRYFYPSTLHPRRNRPLPFSLGKRDFLISKKVYSCTFFFLLDPISRYRDIRWGKGWVKIWGGISHGLREWPPEAFNQLANSTVLYPRNR